MTHCRTADVELHMAHCRTAELELHMTHCRTAEGNFQEVREGAGAPLRDPLCAWRADGLLHAQRDLQNEDPPGYLAEGPKLGPLFANPPWPYFEKLTDSLASTRNAPWAQSPTSWTTN